YTQRSFERPLQVKRALPELSSELSERQWLIEVALDVAADRFDHADLRIPSRCRGAAAHAGTVARLFCLAGCWEKFHILAAWPLRRARRATVDSSGRNGKDELIVQPRIAGCDRLPVT